MLSAARQAYMCIKDCLYRSWLLCCLDGDNANALLGFLDLAYLSTYAIGMFVS